MVGAISAHGQRAWWQVSRRAWFGISFMGSGLLCLLTLITICALTTGNVAAPPSYPVAGRGGAEPAIKLACAKELDFERNDAYAALRKVRMAF
ncbi:MAG: hypothetical protein AAGD13_19550 [Pseudomonadota bacterium]